jgi:hypothetical protein
MILSLVATPAGAVHDETAETLIIPWQHDGETFTAEVGQPFEVGARWGACTADYADDFPVWPDLKGPTLEVSGPSASWPAVEWTDPINPENSVNLGDPFANLCPGGQPGDTGWHVYWRTPITFNSVGTYQVTLSMSTETAVFDGVVSAIVDVAATITVEVGRFSDTHGHTFEADIEWMANEGITKGCNPPTNDLFCPDSVVTRGQMAAFLVRALGLTDRLDNPFSDDDGHVFEADIERLAAAGITKGCNPPTNDRFCPDGKVSREQMAAFLVRALGYTDPGAGDLFVDDDLSIFEGDIDRMATAGVTKGCNPPTNDRYCPSGNVTRGQMAAFLHRALS